MQLSVEQVSVFKDIGLLIRPSPIYLLPVNTSTTYHTELEILVVT